jgi:arabinose-5-phosphate isomerase
MPEPTPTYLVCPPDSSGSDLGPRELLGIAREVLQIEAEGILHLLDHLDESFATAVEWIFGARGRVIVTGIGKSGVVGRKIVATLSSTGTPALFLHPVEAMHGDLGVVRGGDIVLALSNSGETDELNLILPTLRSVGTHIIAFTGRLDSALVKYCDLAIYTGVPREACPLGLAPTASTTAMLAMGDALAVALIKKRNFQVQDFQRTHPGGHLGERLDIRLSELMLTGEQIPAVSLDTSIEKALAEMDAKRLGATLVLGPNRELEGIFTDGDLRRAIRRHGDLRGKVVNDLMTRRPTCLNPDQSVGDALEVMEQRLITVLPVVDHHNRIEGILHLHDLLGKGQISFKAQDPGRYPKDNRQE